MTVATVDILPAVATVKGFFRGLGSLHNIPSQSILLHGQYNEVAR